MKVVPIKPGLSEDKAPVIDGDLIVHLEDLLEAAREGRVQSYLCSFVLNRETDRWWWVEPEWEAEICHQAQKLINSFQAPED